MNELKELKDRLGKVNQLLDKLDERLVQGELSEAKYKELAEKYRAEAEGLKNQIAERELLQEVGLKTEEKKETIVEPPAEKSYLFRVIQRLRNDGYDCYENATYDNYSFKYVAKKVGGVVFAEAFFVFAKFPSINVYSLREFSANCVGYAKKARGSSRLLRNLFCFPVAIVDSIDRATSEYVRNEAGQFSPSTGTLEMPVVYDLASNTLYYFEKTPFIGWAAWGRVRETIQRLLAP